MNKLYRLIINDLELCDDNYKESFDIGCFSSFKKAEQTAGSYLKEIQGFKDYHCDYEITEKKIIGTSDDVRFVYLIQGWNVNDNFDETDIVESAFFTDKGTAQKEFSKMKAQYDRSEWSLNQYTINECLWTEGFVRA